MAQLTADKSHELSGIDAALETIFARVPRIAQVEEVRLFQADGRVLAQDVVADRDLPPFDNSAVDGYAVAWKDVAEDLWLPVSTRIVAGSSVAHELAPGTAARIFTGAQLPGGADTVFMQEDVREDAGRVCLPTGLSLGANTRRRGEDLRIGTSALAAGRRLQPHDVALASGLGLESVVVRRQPKVAVFSTGDEIVDPGSGLGVSQRYDSNRIMLATLLGRAGAAVTDLGILPDDPAILQAALAAAASGHDMIVTTGGVSVGEEDHVKGVVEALGELSIWRLAIKPGRPLAFGRVGATPFMGLPGNPVAAFITFVSVLRPALAAMTGETLQRDAFRLPSSFSYRKKKGRREFVRGRLEQAVDGWRIAKHEVEGAAVLTSLTSTDGLVELGEEITTVQPGDLVAFRPYATLF